MKYKIITKCPVCEEELEVTTLVCPGCSTKYEGHFVLDKFSYLTAEQKYFIEIFLKCRGNIKEVEKELNISYPTVRSRLNDIIYSLGYDISGGSEKSDVDKDKILDMLDNGEISANEAIKILKGR
ncbi:MAG: DUF2089 domain-containing protein [Xylanivirga thermophila]|jgi:hypothetical protein|uniref:DUF2089 domain-containing protein n=1 Tax=Xylanivirga thermophila TaxID=2496273 RepID=UPI00101C99F5|nr:DUF2089 domain-containing protein [Xylanivirga thermophila]